MNVTDFYVTVSSNDSLEYFQDNNGSNFRVHLKRPLQFEGFWVCALCDLEYASTTPNEGNLWVYSNVCNDSIVGGVELPLLRRVPIESNIQHSKFISFSQFYRSRHT